MLYAKAYAFSQECYNKTAYSGYQILLDDKSLRGLIHQGIKSDLHSMSKLRHASGIMVFLNIQDTYGRGHFADDNQYASHLNIQLSHEFNSAQGSVTTYIKRFLNKAMLHKQCVNGTSDDQLPYDVLYALRSFPWNQEPRMERYCRNAKSTRMGSTYHHQICNPLHSFQTKPMFVVFEASKLNLFQRTRHHFLMIWNIKADNIVKWFSTFLKLMKRCVEETKKIPTLRQLCIFAARSNKKVKWTKRRH